MWRAEAPLQKGCPHKDLCAGAHYAAYFYSSVAWGSASDDGLVVGASEKPRAEATRVNLFESGALADGGSVDCFAISARGERDIVGVLVAAFDFERGDSDAHDLGDLF